MIIIVLVLIIIWLLDDGTKTVYKNGRKFKVRRYYEYDETVQQLENIMKDLESFVHYLTQNRVFSEAKTRTLNYKVKNLVLGERPQNEPEVGYTVNKGKEIRVCLRDENDKFIEKDVVLFIVLHEIAHIVTDSYGHTTEFWDNYKKLEKYARMHGFVKNFDPLISCPT